MKFHESGLPGNKVVEDAFNYSYANLAAGQKEALKVFTQQITQMHLDNMTMLEGDKAAGVLKEDEYNMHKDAINKMRDEQMKAGPGMIADQMGRMFAQRRVAPAREVALHSDNPSPDLLAAILLIECVRSPVDYQNVATKFGTTVAGIVAEVAHIEAYPTERETNLAKAGTDTKRAFLSLLITSLDQIAEQIDQAKRLNPLQRIIFPPGQEEMLFGNAKIVWGNDAKMDERFMHVFNKASDAASSAFKIELDGSGAPELVKGALSVKKPVGPKPPVGPGGNGGMGGDVF